MYKLSNLAAEDFASIYEYTLLNFGVFQADAYTDNLEGTLRLLSGSPLMGYECPEICDGVRRHDHQRHAIFTGNVSKIFLSSGYSISRWNR